MRHIWWVKGTLEVFGDYIQIIQGLCLDDSKEWKQIEITMSLSFRASRTW